MTNLITLKNNLSEHFTLISYPDGQRNVKLNLEMLDVKKPVDIQCRIRNFSDLEVLSCLCAALYRNDYRIEEITFKYLFGMRSDRCFNPGEANYFRNVLAPIICSTRSLSEIASIFIEMPHSLSNARDLGIKTLPSYLKRNQQNYILIAADKSALNHYHDIYRNDLSFNKKRGVDGIEAFLTDQMIEIVRSSDKKEILIYDDLCDGGATFIYEADYLKNLFPEKLVSLYVHHAIFSHSIHHVTQHFHKVYVSNSYKDYSNQGNLVVFDVWED